MNAVQALVNRVLRMETISGDGLCPVYMYRWTLLRLGKWGAAYLHRIVGDDWSRDLHDHPKRFVSIGLAGEYWEETGPWWTDTRHYRAPWVRTFPPEHCHRLRVFPRPGDRPSRNRPGAWTLCIVGPPRREWGFWYRGHSWVNWREYVYGPKGAERKDC